MERPAFTRQQLYELVWKEPIQTLAPKFGLSDRGLAKLCERHAIPTPARGYWAKKQAGHKVAKAPLIELEGSRFKETHAIARFAPPSPAGEPKADAPDPLVEFWRAQREEIGVIPVAKTLANPHRVIATWLKEDEREREVQARWGGHAFGLMRLNSLDRRRLRLLSALYKALEARGVSIECPRGGRVVELRHAHDRVAFDLKEYVQQKRRPLSDEERADGWGHAKYRVEQIPTGLLRGKVDAYLSGGIATQWTETAETPFESLLGDVAATVLAALAAAKARREAQEIEQRRRWEAQEAARKREEAAKAERARQHALRARAKAWRQADELRDYVAAVRAAAADGRLTPAQDELARWSAWALSHADELDPISAGDALETSERNRHYWDRARGLAKLRPWT